jgi:hypothetical protein
MSDFLTLFGDWHLYVVFFTYYVFSNAVSALPLPDTESSKLYGWFFKFMNGLAANISRATAGKIPGTTDVMPLPGAQDAVNKVAIMVKAAEEAQKP